LINIEKVKIQSHEMAEKYKKPYNYTTAVGVSYMNIGTSS
jgi:hypothetical protein